MIVDKDGSPLVVYERRAMGFIARTLPTESSEPPSIPKESGDGVGKWRADSDENESQQVFAKK